MTTAYPKRPPFFCMRFMRVLLRSCASQVIGADGGMLLMCIAQVEDSKRYSDAVTFWNDQLLPIIGLRNWAALDRARQRCVDEGWLHYEPGGKGKTGRYWVTIPACLEVLDDQPLGVNDGDIPTGSMMEITDRSVIETGKPTASIVEINYRSGKETGKKQERNGKETGSKRDQVVNILTSPIPIPNPNPINAAAATEPNLDPSEQVTTRMVDGTIHSGDTLPPVSGDPVHGLGVWVRWRSPEAARQAENIATLQALVASHGAKVVQRVAERLQRSGNPDRSRKPGDKVWADEILPEVLRAEAAKKIEAANAKPEKPAVVLQALALVERYGAAAARTALGWPQTTAPTLRGLQIALEREALAEEVVKVLGARAVTPGALVVSDV